MYLPTPICVFGEISAQSAAAATVRLSPVSCVHGPFCVAADRDHGAIEGMETKVARANSTLKKARRASNPFFFSLATHSSNSDDKGSATSCVCSPSCVVVDTDQDASGAQK